MWKSNKVDGFLSNIWSSALRRTIVNLFCVGIFAFNQSANHTHTRREKVRETWMSISSREIRLVTTCSDEKCFDTIWLNTELNRHNLKGKSELNTEKANSWALKTHTATTTTISRSSFIYSHRHSIFVWRCDQYTGELEKRLSCTNTRAARNLSYYRVCFLL